MRDQSTIHRVLRGDRQAGEQFVSKHYDRIYRLLRHLTGNPDVVGHPVRSVALSIKLWNID